MKKKPSIRYVKLHANFLTISSNRAVKEKFINLFTDFGFKKAFCEEASKEHLISFLNTLLPEKHQIQELQFNQNERQGASALDRKAIFDLSCVSSTGEYFIVELPGGTGYLTRPQRFDLLRLRLKRFGRGYKPRPAKDNNGNSGLIASIPL